MPAPSPVIWLRLLGQSPNKERLSHLGVIAQNWSRQSEEAQGDCLAKFAADAEANVEALSKLG